MEQYLFGIDVGGTTVKCGLFRRSGELLEKWEIPTRTEENGRQIKVRVCKKKDCGAVIPTTDYTK